MYEDYSKEDEYLTAIKPYFQKAIDGDEKANEQMRQAQKKHFEKYYPNQYPHL